MTHKHRRKKKVGKNTVLHCVTNSTPLNFNPCESCLRSLKVVDRHTRNRSVNYRESKTKKELDMFRVRKPRRSDISGSGLLKSSRTSKTLLIRLP